jgi:hypothetical protein
VREMESKREGNFWRKKKKKKREKERESSEGE